MLYSLKRLSSFRLIVPVEAANNFVMDAKLVLSATSTIVKPDNGLAVAVGFPSDLFSLEENETLIDDVSLVCDDADCRLVGCDEAPFVEIVSEKELNLDKFMIQPSIFLSSVSSVTFCQETFRVVDETASTMTNSG